jgi:sigma-B regulation protein RsbU (phosphoserine phosphatase)
MDSLLDNAPCGFVTFTDDGRIHWANKTLLRWLSFSLADLTGKNIELILTISSRIFYNTHFFPLLKLHLKADEIFLQLKTSQNEDVPALVNAERRLEPDGYMSHCVIIPLHQRKKYEEEILLAKRQAELAIQENVHLQELKTSLEKKSLELEGHYQKQFSANRSLLLFSKIISHDLQEPIHKIQLFADRIQTKEPVSERARVDLTKITKAAERLRILTRALEHYVSIDTEKYIAQVDINEVIRNAVADVNESRQIPDYDLILDDIPPIGGYPKQMSLLFFHLLDNAVQFRDPSRRLQIHVTSLLLDENLYQLSPNRYKYTEHVRITFEDNGIGFDMQYKDYVFEILKKISPSSEGLGVGLGLIKKVVDNHAGTIKVESKPEKGTTFIITLPKNPTHH